MPGFQRWYGIVDVRYGGAIAGRFAYTAHGITESFSACTSLWTSLRTSAMSLPLSW